MVFQIFQNISGFQDFKFSGKGSELGATRAKHLSTKCLRHTAVKDSSDLLLLLFPVTTSINISSPTRDIFVSNVRDQGHLYKFKGTLTDNLLIRSRGEKLRFSKD